MPEGEEFVKLGPSGPTMAIHFQFEILNMFGIRLFPLGTDCPVVVAYRVSGRIKSLF
ncbi:MAG: hypothetical protein Ct9H300mP28_35360 [Pseudomonadota bacterium]|nr:MAG: hypothetical protein Ct9H300mP28_35360 [Pseudomonadota bacterium]